ncbi:hypothetical protein [Methanolapillus millepedarum]|uniref:Uncharacterized protein n=1 Tax=Methanolapillus millepedarum TaxID=3028296 RepID=A0AA96V513_9EURY|nr:hypothetical protein MsAc7_16220 [Methanosarcinaceae archaeon Ac7]
MNQKTKIMLSFVFIVFVILSVMMIPSIIQKRSDNNVDCNCFYRYIQNNYVYLTKEEVEIYQCWKNDPEAFGPHSNKNILAVFGKLSPKTGEDLYHWWTSARLVNTGYELTHYSRENGGPIIGEEVSSFGFMVIYVNSEKQDNLTAEDLERIVQIIEQKAEENGIENLPVVFYSKKWVPPESGGVGETLPEMYILAENGQFLDDSIIYKC